jgi:hypothetical protein
MEFSARESSPLVNSASRSCILTMLIKACLFGWRRDGKCILRSIDPLIAFVNQHHGDIIYNWIFASAVLTNKPHILMQNKQSLFFTHATGAS